jgi:3-hydroxyisobutyrate dehydrogenase
MELGLCGTGRMGSAMVMRLLDEGHAVTVWNRSPDKAKPLLDRGALWAASPAEVAARHEIVLTILHDWKAVDAVYGGPRGLLTGAVAGRLFVDMTTLAPAVVKDLASRVKAKGAGFVDCPVGGTVGPARDGRLLGLAGGDPADFARAKPVLEALCRRLDHLGENGNGAAMKLAINLPLCVYWEALGEAMAMCRDAAIDPALMLAIMQESSGGANVLKNRAPNVLQALAAGAKPEVGFDIAGGRKDLALMVETARAMGFAVPVTEKALECYDAAIRDGWAEMDGSALAVYRFNEARQSPKG